MASAVVASPRDAARGHLLSVGSIVAGGVVLSAVYAVAGVGLPCPLKLATGWDCPLCGGTRMGASLLHLDLKAAVVYNPLALIGLVVVVVLSLGWLVQLIRDRRPRWSTTVSSWARRLPTRTWWVAGAVATIGYVLLRNLIWPIPA